MMGGDGSKALMEDDSDYDISVADVDGDSTGHDACLVRAVEATLRQHGVTKAAISLALVDDRRIADLNERHLRHDGPTDVLTFDLRDQADPAPSIEDDSDTVPHRESEVDGEIVMSLETASREAASRGHALSAELALYAIHGTLHLLGHDDADETQAARMHATEDQILQELGLGAVYGGESS